jgi:hypothetical protein
MPPGVGRASTGSAAPLVRSCFGVRERPRLGVGSTEEFLDLSFLSVQAQLQPQLGSLARGDTFVDVSSGERSSKAESPRRSGRGLHMLC